jgi:hypothetical protein
MNKPEFSGKKTHDTPPYASECLTLFCTEIQFKIHFRLDFLFCLSANNSNFRIKLSEKREIVMGLQFLIDMINFLRNVFKTPNLNQT